MYYHFILHFGVSLLIGSLFCIGLWISSRGHTDTKSPDGTPIDEWGMILYPVYKFLANPHYKKVYYFQPYFQKVLDEILPDLKHKITIGQVQTGETNVIVIDPEHKDIIISNMYRFKDLNIFIEILGDNRIRAYKEYFVVRTWSNPIIACYKCFASFWGTIVFIAMTAFAIRLKMITLDYVILIPMWFFYVFCLVCINVYIQKKTN